MLHVKNIIVGSLLLVCQLGCSGGSSRVGAAGAPASAQANISITPVNAISGSPDLPLTITGSQAFSFTNATHKLNQVVWSANGNDTQLPSTFVSGSQLTAIVPAPLLLTPVQAQVRVEIWDVQGDAPIAASSSVPFNVTAPSASPTIDFISPANVPAGSPDLTLSIAGSNFDHTGHLHTSVAFWTTDPSNLHDHGTMLATTVVSTSQLTAVIPAALLQNPGSVQIVVLTGDPMSMSEGFFGYPESNSVTFTVTP